MFAYIIRRVAYAIPILIGINLLTFALFFVVNSPDDMARMHLGMKRVTPEAIEKWKAEHGYDKPVLYNAAAGGIEQLTDTIFFEKSVRLFQFDFGASGQLLLFVGTRSETMEPARYMLPAGIGVDEDGRVYMVDQFFRKVDVFRPAGIGPGEGFMGGRASGSKKGSGTCGTFR